MFKFQDYLINKIKNFDFGKFRAFSLNFNLLSIFFSLSLIILIEYLYSKIFIDLNDFDSIFPFFYLFLKDLIINLTYIFYSIIISFNLILFLYSHISRKFYLIDFNNFYFAGCICFFSLNIVFYVFTFVINYSIYYLDSKFIFMSITSIMQIFFISAFVFFNLLFSIKNLKLKLSIKTDYDYLISKNDILRRKVHLKSNKIECFQYGKITLDIQDNAFFYKKEKYPLNVISEYLTNKNIIISDMTFEDFEVLKMLKY